MANFTFEDLSTKNLKFLSGTQTDLNKYFLDSDDNTKSGQAKEGAFYLTSDTHRLYIGGKISYIEGEGQQATTATAIIPIPVNAGILSVAELSDLPSTENANPGEFYYVTSNNVLCMFNGAQWVQINPDTDTNDIVEVNNISISAGHSVTGTYQKASSYNPNTIYYEYYNNTFNETTATLSASTNFATSTAYYIQSATDGNTLVYTINTNQTKTTQGGNGTATDLDTVVSHLVIPVSDLTDIGKVGLTVSSVTNNNLVLSIDSAYADLTKSVTFVGAGGISLLGGGTTAVTIKGKQYDLRRDSTITTNSASFSLYDITEGTNGASQVNNSTIYINAGDNLSINTAADTAVIALNHTGPGNAVSAIQVTPDKTVVNEKTYYIDSAGTTTASGLVPGATINGIYYEEVLTYGDNNVTVSEGATIKIPKIEKDKNGHIVNISDVGVVLPSARAIGSIEANSSGNIIISDTNGTQIAASDADLYYNIYIDGATATVRNQNLLGNFYSAEKIDNIIENNLRNLNALTYKGTVGGDNSTKKTLPATIEGVSVGDVYLVDNDVTTLTINGTATRVYPGDLLIASGDEFKITTDTAINVFQTYYTQSGTAGAYVYSKVTNPLLANIQSYYINSGLIQSDLVWTRIEAGNIDTQYDLGLVSNNTLNFLEGSSNNIKKSIVIKDDDKWIQTTFATTAIDSITNFIYSVEHIEQTTLVAGTTATSLIRGDTGIASRTLNPSGSFIVPQITIDRAGHIIAAVDKTITLPESNNNTYSLNHQKNNTYDTTLRLLENDLTEKGTITLIGDSDTSVSAVGVMVYGSQTGIYIKHAELTPTTTSTTATVNDNTRQLSAITGIGYDSFGHINSITTTTFTLPNTYSLEGVSSISNTNGVLSFVNSLKQGTTERGTITYKTNTLDFSVESSTDSATSYVIDLKWGSF